MTGKWWQSLLMVFAGAIVGTLLTLFLLVHSVPLPSSHELDVVAATGTLAGGLAAFIGILFTIYTIWVNSQPNVTKVVRQDLERLLDRRVTEGHKSAYLAERALDVALPVDVRSELIREAEEAAGQNPFSLARIKCTVLLDNVVNSITSSGIDLAALGEVAYLSKQLMAQFPEDAELFRYQTACEAFTGRANALQMLDRCRSIYGSKMNTWVKANEWFAWSMLTLALRLGPEARAKLESLIGVVVISGEDLWSELAEQWRHRSYSRYVYYAIKTDGAYEIFNIRVGIGPLPFVVLWNDTAYGDTAPHDRQELEKALTRTYAIALLVEDGRFMP